MDIDRKNYIQQLKIKMENGFLKIITGLHRCGKSHLLFTGFRNELLHSGIEEERIIEISFDRLEYKKYQNPELVYSYIKDRMKSDETYFILLDEIHLLKDAYSVINSLMHLHNTDLYLTDSDSHFLQTGIMEPFSGRVDELRLYPLSFSEFMSVYNGNRYDGWNEYILYGGLPSTVLIRDKEQKTLFLRRLLQDSFISDIAKRGKVRNREELTILLELLSAEIGSLTNPRQLSDLFLKARYIRISQTTLKNYIEHYQHTSLLSVTPRYDLRNRKYITTPVKYYFSDIGLRNAGIEFRKIAENRIMENVIYNELLIRGYKVNAGVSSYSVRNESGQTVRKQMEIDFICSKATRRYYIQSAFSLPDEERIQQVQEPFRHIDDFFKRIIITKDCPAPYYTEKGVLIMNIYDFLLNPESLSF